VTSLDHRGPVRAHLEPGQKGLVVWHVLGEQGVLSKLVIMTCDVLQERMRLSTHIFQLYQLAPKPALLCQGEQVGVVQHVWVLAVHPHIRLQGRHLSKQDWSNIGEL